MKPTWCRIHRSARAPMTRHAKAATQAIADLKAKKPIYVGPLKDNKGNVVIEQDLR